jgi:hypothetical protein
LINRFASTKVNACRINPMPYKPFRTCPLTGRQWLLVIFPLCRWEAQRQVNRFDPGVYLCTLPNR